MGSGNAPTTTASANLSLTLMAPSLGRSGAVPVASCRRHSGGRDAEAALNQLTGP